MQSVEAALPSPTPPSCSLPASLSLRHGCRRRSSSGHYIWIRAALRFGGGCLCGGAATHHARPPGGRHSVNSTHGGRRCACSFSHCVPSCTGLHRQPPTGRTRNPMLLLAPFLHPHRRSSCPTTPRRGTAGSSGSARWRGSGPACPARWQPSPGLQGAAGTWSGWALARPPGAGRTAQQRRAAVAYLTTLCTAQCWASPGTAPAAPRLPAPAAAAAPARARRSCGRAGTHGSHHAWHARPAQRAQQAAASPVTRRRRGMGGGASHGQSAPSAGSCATLSSRCLGERY